MNGKLRMWRQDAAGNQEPANASVPVMLRFDPDPPELAFETSPSSDPTLISVAVTDKISGLASGQIEIEQARFRYVASAEHPLQGSRLVARVDDSLLPPGVYQLRATARDRASNQNSTDRRDQRTADDGDASSPNNDDRMKAGVVGERIVSRVIKRRR